MKLFGNVHPVVVADENVDHISFPALNILQKVVFEQLGVELEGVVLLYIFLRFLRVLLKLLDEKQFCQLRTRGGYEIKNMVRELLVVLQRYVIGIVTDAEVLVRHLRLQHRRR